MLVCEHFYQQRPTGSDLYLYWPDGMEAGYMCPECAISSGFCPGCGAFIGGIDSEIPNITSFGMCSVCLEDIES